MVLDITCSKAPNDELTLKKTSYLAVGRARVAKGAVKIRGLKPSKCGAVQNLKRGREFERTEVRWWRKICGLCPHEHSTVPTLATMLLCNDPHKTIESPSGRELRRYLSNEETGRLQCK